MIGRVIGLALLLAGLVAAGAEIADFAGSGRYQMLSLGELWARIDSNSLVGLQAFIEKNVSQTAFLDIIVPILAAPLWPILALVGALILFVLRPRRRGRFGRRP